MATIITTREIVSNNGAYSYIANGIQNTTLAGGALRFDGTSPSIVLYGSTFTNCKGKFGGAVSQDNDSSTAGGTFQISNSIFTNNIAGQYGGAVNIQGASATITGCTFTTNRTTGTTEAHGGAMFIHKAANVTVTSCTFNGNYVSGDKSLGGAIFCHLDGTNGTLTIRDSQFLTATDTIYCNKKLSVFDGTCYFGAAIYSATKIEIKGNITVNSELDCANVTLDAGSKLTLGPNSTVKSGTALNCSSNSTVEFDCATADLTKISGTPKVRLTEKVTAITGDQSKYDITRVKTNQLVVGSGTTVNLKSVISSGEFGPITSRQFANYGAIVVGGTLSGNYTTASPLNITSNTAVHGGGVLVNATGDATLQKVSFTANTVTNNGGAVYNNGSVTISGGDFTYNSANFGGVMYNLKTATISNAILSGNSAGTGGGAILNAAGASACVSNATFSNNSAVNYGGAINNAGSAEIYGGTFTNNSATSGGAANLNAANASVYVSNAIFDGNSVTSHGGAINNAGNAIIFGGGFSSNVATLNGGAIFNIGSAAITSAAFNGNSANRGGAVYNVSTATMNGGTFTSNAALGTGENDGGGALYNCDSAVITNAVFSGNTAENKGGAIYNIIGATAIIDSITFTRNSANAGGAIYTVTSAIISDTVFNSNSAVNGGSLRVVGDAIVLSAQFNNNTVSNNGGAVYVDGNKQLNVNSASFLSNNAAKYGGAVYNAGTVTIDNAVVANNSSILGGGIYAKSVATLTNMQLNNNSATGFGGAGIYVDTDATVSCTNNTFTSNAGSRGGAILNKGTVTIASGSFTGNSVSVHGGAIYNSGHVSISGTNESKVVFSGNTATSKGGAIFNASQEYTVNLSNVSFLSNSASEGGAVYNKGTTNLTNVLFSGNTGAFVNYENASAIFNGSALFNTTDDAVLNDGTVVVAKDALVSAECPIINNSIMTISGMINLGDSGSIINNGTLVLDLGANAVVSSLRIGSASTEPISVSVNGIALVKNKRCIFARNAHDTENLKFNVVRNSSIVSIECNGADKVMDNNRYRICTRKNDSGNETDIELIVMKTGSNAQYLSTNDFMSRL